MFDKWVRKDFRSAGKITTVARTREKLRFDPWMTSPLEARQNRGKGMDRPFELKGESMLICSIIQTGFLSQFKWPSSQD